MEGEMAKMGGRESARTLDFRPNRRGSGPEKFVTFSSREL